MLKTHDNVTYVRTNGEVVKGTIERMSKLHKAAYIKQYHDDKIVAAPLDRVQKQ